LGKIDYNPGLILFKPLISCLMFLVGSGYKTTHGSLNLKPYPTTSCNVALTQRTRKCSRLGRT